MKVIDQLVVEARLEVQRAHEAGDAEQFGAHNPFIDGFLEWMDAPEGQQSIEASDLVFAALAHAGVDARQRKIIWADGKRLSIEQSAERMHAEHPGVLRDLIETHVLGWLESCAPESYSERQLEELDRLIEPWLDDYERTSRAGRT
ncbi:MAG TPA: hypothetical protein VMU81_03210 [Acetobacteraceae bacterium]|nr:hypothetical protein [Acetobacteraceae bacterium]